MPGDKVPKTNEISAYFLDIETPLLIEPEYIEAMLTAAISLVDPNVIVNVQKMGKFEEVASASEAK